MPVDLDTPGLKILHFDPPVFALPAFFSGGCRPGRRCRGRIDTRLPALLAGSCRASATVGAALPHHARTTAAWPSRPAGKPLAEEECDDAVAAAVEGNTLVPSKVGMQAGRGRGWAGQQNAGAFMAAGPYPDPEGRQRVLVAGSVVRAPGSAQGLPTPAAGAMTRTGQPSTPGSHPEPPCPVPALLCLGRAEPKLCSRRCPALAPHSLCAAGGRRQPAGRVVQRGQPAAHQQQRAAGCGGAGGTTTAAQHGGGPAGQVPPGEGLVRGS